MVKASGCDPDIRGFDPHQSPQILLRDRLTAGQWTLTPFIVVRIHFPQPILSRWCNGNITVSKTVVGGSSPSRDASLQGGEVETR